jgi:site-specific DNA-methyltransferase (adenine-specific)
MRSSGTNPMRRPTWLAECLQLVMKLCFGKSKKARHLFNYEAMKTGDFPKDFLKNPGKQMRSVWAIGFPSREEKQFGKHPTQKPIALLDRIIRATTNPGMTVLDPFCGSATTGVAAIANGSKFIGIDLDIKFLQEIAAPRLRLEEQNILKG